MLAKAPKKIAILICDDIRAEAGGKITISGVYSNGVYFNNDTPDNKLYTPQFAIYGLFESPDTDFRLSINIKSPSGEILVKGPDQDIKVYNNIPITTGLKFSGITFKEIGTHTVEFVFDGEKKITYKFEVGLLPPKLEKNEL
ncbi:DUF6941 family protein [Pseudomonas sp. XK-1]|uniref:DUF6941 family protein n=1 Tax=Pseudomonas sp. XK-1 TaxID=3136019 RepID=UPI003119784D